MAARVLVPLGLYVADHRARDFVGLGDVGYLAGRLAVSSASRRLPSSVNTKRPPRVRLISPIDISSSRASLDKNLASPLATRRSELTSAELSEAFGLRRRMIRQSMAWFHGGSTRCVLRTLASSSSRTKQTDGHCAKLFAMMR
jgi:hypothetical protein